MKRISLAAVAAAALGLRVRGTQVNRHYDIWNGLRGVCTRRARVIEVGFWSGIGGRES